MLRKFAAAVAAVIFSGVIASAITLFSPTIGDVNMPGLTPNYPAGTYVKSAPLTGFSLTFGNAQGWLILNPAGTLSTGAVTLAPAPPDGLRSCVFTTQIISTLTLNANAGQSINNAVTTLAANTGACYTYGASNATWDRS